MGVTVEDKGHMDALHERSLERFGVGIGVVVQEEERFRRQAASHAAERAAMTGWRGLVGRIGWPFSQWHRLRRMEAESTAAQVEWNRRLRLCAADVARALPDEPRTVVHEGGEA